MSRFIIIIIIEGLESSGNKGRAGEGFSTRFRFRLRSRALEDHTLAYSHFSSSVRALCVSVVCLQRLSFYVFVCQATRDI